MIKNIEGLKENNIIGFFREDEEYGCFSNWYACEFEYAGKKYANSEQFMMYQKMMAFGAYDVADKILETTDPYACKRLGKTAVGNWDTEFWDKVGYPIVKRGVRAKFVQNPDFRKVLLDTGNALLAECSPWDEKWGIGVDIQDEAMFDVNNWNGSNYLGRILMEVRDELRMYELIGGSGKGPVYRDAWDMDPVPEWKMTFGELMRIPKFRRIVSDYVEVTEKSLRDKFSKFLDNEYVNILDYTPYAVEQGQRDNMGGGFPPQDFREMKQEFYETVNNMWIS